MAFFADLLNSGVGYAREYLDRKQTGDNARRQYELESQRIALQNAKEKKALELAAAQRTQAALEGNTLRTIAIWVGTTIAGTIVGAIVLDLVRK